jgi:predicted DNA-binding transcriptional regulator AlpA
MRQPLLTTPMQPLLTTRAAAELLCLDQRTLERFRVAGTGPKFVKMGKSIRYRPSDLEAWLATRTVSSTSQEFASRQPRKSTTQIEPRAE